MSQSLLIGNSSNVKHVENNHYVTSKCDHITTNSECYAINDHIDGDNSVGINDHKNMVMTTAVITSTIETSVTTTLTSTNTNVITSSECQVINLPQSGTKSELYTNIVNANATSPPPTITTTDNSSTCTTITELRIHSPSSVNNSIIIKRSSKPIESFVQRIEKDEEGTRPFNQLFRRSISNIHFTTNSHMYSHYNHYNNSNTFFLPRTPTDPTTSATSGLQPTSNDTTELMQMLNKKFPIRRGSMIVS
ncbi:hypothetical protein MN116_008879 [Schistosoma mekongi]|uniref:Uncharacterized protein n=1 Tax=Schistosoma mekongi TaxID=38744 RepID=A0AAE1Z4U5_SCHME|nr:hypothetical protein MN116_008879 [Schistosoma mekongi]